ncbi:protocadherin alpha-12 isoform X4 [Amia ocellicauda]|uniref:protocadherin alpha-12 isoform X4 n=1 Tax=Amia ocellicauda TaxID=2972642 RepID=UPI0034647438
MGFGECRRRKYRLTILGYALVSFLWETAWAQLHYSVREEVELGSVVGNVAKDLGLDISQLEDRKFRIVSGSQQRLLEVNQNNGVLFVNENVDRERLCDRNSKCFINLKIVLENPLEIHYVEVEITDINDNSPVFPEKEKLLEIVETTLPGARFPLQGARDADVGLNSLRLYKLSHNEHFELEVQGRSDNKIPILILRKHLDREKSPEHNVLLTALDGGSPARSGILNITVTVLDINDNAPVFEQPTYTVTLDENVPVGTFVIQVKASDTDHGPNGQVEYSFGNTFGNKALELFSLNIENGVIKVNGPIDYEENDVYEIDVQASDKGNSPFIVHCSVLVQIKDVNDNEPAIEITSLSSLIPEDASPGTVIALISVTDGDSGSNGQVVCSLPENMPFDLKPSFRDDLYSLITKGHLDRELISTYNLSITAKDNGTPPLSSFKSITVQITDVNDNSPQFTQDQYTLYLPENNVPGASIFSVSAVDRDQHENALVSYYMGGRAVDSNSVSSFLNINSENGNIYALRSFDFESLKSFSFQVAARDAGVPSLSSNATVTVFILDQNDNVPTILSPLSDNGTADVVEKIPRNVNAGYLVTKIRAYDADIGYNAWLSFSLQQVTDSSLFGLDRYTGQIRTLRAFTEADETEHKLIIQVKDNGNISLSTTATILISTFENTESFAVSDINNAAKQAEGNDVTFYLIVTLGSVSALFVISIITLIIIQCSRPRGSSKSSRDSKYIDVSGNGTLCHSIQYRAGEKRYMLVGPRMSVCSATEPRSNRNTLVFADKALIASEQNGEVCNSGTTPFRRSQYYATERRQSKPPNADWRYSASLRAGMQSSVHMEESAVLQGAPGVLVQNWPTVSSATGGEPEGGEVSPPVGAGINSNSWTFRYGPGPGHPQALKPGEVPEAFIIPGSPAIISIRQDQPTGDDKSDFITFGKKEETKKKKKKKKGKADKKEKGGNDNSEH